MKKFTFKYTATVWALLTIVLVLSLIGLIWNVFNFISFIDAGAFKITIYLLISVLTAILLVIVLSVMIYGRYVIKDGNLYSYFGIIKSKTPISDVVEITHFKKSDKLVVYFKDAKYTVIVIAPELYDQFVLSLREHNKSIIFDAKIDGEDLAN